MKECLCMFMAAVAMFVVSVCRTDYADSPRGGSHMWPGPSRGEAEKSMIAPEDCSGFVSRKFGGNKSFHRKLSRCE